MNIKANVAAMGLGVSLIAAPWQAALAQDAAIDAASEARTTETVSEDTRYTAVRKRLESEFQEMQVDEIQATPFADLLEVRVGKNIIYTNAEVDFVLQGALIDVANRTDLTAQRLEQINRVDVAALPLEQGIKIVKGDGSRTVVVFEDPNCPYCKRLHESFKGLDNVTIYSMMYPILSLDSIKKAESIWCASDPTQALTDWMLNDKAPAEAKCDDNPIANIVELGGEMGIRGTPAVIFEDGSQVGGWLPADKLKERVEQAAENVAKAKANDQTS